MKNSSATSVNRSQADELDLAKYLDVIVTNRWLIGGVVAGFVFMGAAIAFLSSPTYEADILIQVEDSQSANLLGDASDFFATKAAASAEMEIIKSRLVVAEAVDNLKLYLSARPNYLPLVGGWLARRSEGLSDPGFLWLDGYVRGKEAINLTQLDVPPSVQGAEIELTYLTNNEFEITSDAFDGMLKGRIGYAENLQSSAGNIQIKVDEIAAKPGAKFIIRRASRLQTIENLRASLVVSEQGRQSGVIGAQLLGGDPSLTSSILNEIAHAYVKRNVERKSAEAEKSLEFLDAQLPSLKRQLEESEDKYNSLRNKVGTVDLGEEAKLALQKSVEGQTKLFELEQTRRELLNRFTTLHPAVKAVDVQIGSLQRELEYQTRRIKQFPTVEQDIVRLTRDVQVNTQLYTALLNSAQQLRLVKAGRIGNVRLVDEAVVPEVPVRPQKGLILALAALIGIIFGIAAAFVRNALFGGIQAPHDIEDRLGLNVTATVPFSQTQKVIASRLQAIGPAVQKLLSEKSPYDPAIEALRSLSTTLQFSLGSAKNNIVLVTGPTPGVGKSFVSSNFAAVLAAANRRVLLIDCDLRKGYLNKYFGVPREPGFADVLAGKASIDTVTKRGLLTNLDFIPTGSLPLNPGELLQSLSMDTLMAELSSRYDIVMIDTPPVLAAADASVVAKLVGSILLICRAEVTTLGEVEESTKRLDQVGATVTGVVFNGLNAHSAHYRYGSRYGRYRYAAYTYKADEHSN